MRVGRQLLLGRPWLAFLLIAPPVPALLCLQHSTLRDLLLRNGPLQNSVADTETAFLAQGLWCERGSGDVPPH